MKYHAARKIEQFWIHHYRRRAAIKIQRHFRQYLHCRPHNDRCPITLDPFDDVHVYFDHVVDSVVTRFDAHALKAYMTEACRIQNPLTNVDFYRCELMRLDRLLDLKGDEKIIVQMRSFAAKRKASAERRNMVDFLSSELGDLCVLITDLYEDEGTTLSFKIARLESTVFPQITTTLHDFVQFDQKEAIDAIKNNIEYLQNASNGIHYLVIDEGLDYLTTKLDFIEKKLMFGNGLYLAAPFPPSFQPHGFASITAAFTTPTPAAPAPSPAAPAPSPAAPAAPAGLPLLTTISIGPGLPHILHNLPSLNHIPMPFALSSPIPVVNLVPSDASEQPQPITIDIDNSSDEAGSSSS